MIPGLSGSILSHDALEAAGFADQDASGAAAEREIGRWHAQLARTAGPAWSARQVFDHVVVPLCTVLGFRVVPGGADRGVVHAALHAGDLAAALVFAIPWGQDHAGGWRDAVRLGIRAGVRWCLSVNGTSARLFDAQRTHSRRHAEFDLARVATDRTTFALAWRLLRADAFRTSALAAAVAASERYRAQVRESLQHGVHEALTHLTSAFLDAGRRTRSRRGPAPAAAFDESLVVIYRILFLLFAEARGLVPTWHPVFREGYTIEALRPAVETGGPAGGVWEALQAIARLAHRGCRAGSLRVPPFNGRLFSPAQAPLADALPLDDRRVREALLALTTEQRRDRRQRIAYADLGVEQLGGVYERVLDYEIGAPDRDGRSVLVRSPRRKATGSFYTPRSLTEHLVRRTLAPLVAEASPERILSVRVLDPAMGSGAFLVAACRYLAHAYEQALVREGAVTALDIDDAERGRFRRAVAQRCLFGVDINPMAVQLGRLSLWLATLAGDRPLTFFDHHLRTGNSLVGADLHAVTRAAPGRRRRTASLPLFDTDAASGAVGAAVTSHLALTDGQEDTLEQVRAKERLFADLHAPGAPLARWRRVLDLWCAGWFGAPGGPLTRGIFQALLEPQPTLPAAVADGLLERAAAAAGRERFFHWPLEFPEVFATPDGAALPNPGFDAVIGNPPWEMLRGPNASALTRFSRDSGIYRLHGAGHANLFQLFVERALTLARRGGRVGLVLPSGFATDHGCAPLRRHVLEATAVDAVTSVENREALFPIHRGLKFLLLTATTGGRTDVVPLRAGLRTAADFDRLPESGPDPSAVTLTRTLLERISGEQVAIPELRSSADVELVSRLTLAHPPAGAPDGWGLRFGRELNATDDRRHFTAAGGGLPVVEGKQVQPFQVDLGESRQFVEARTAARLLPATPFARPRLAYRDVAAATNRCTLIAAVLPAGCVTTHTLFCARHGGDEDEQHFLCGLFNSYVANYLVRLRVSTHVTVAIVERLPLPAVARDGAAFHAMVALSRRLARGPDADAAAAHQALAARLYGLTAAEFAHVLSTFPLVSRATREGALGKFVDRI